MKRRGSRESEGEGYAPTVAASVPQEAIVEGLYGQDFGPGAIIGEYVVEERHTRGGFAVIYRAHAVGGSADRPVAIKVLRRDLATTETLRRFEREAETLKRLRHPNIVEFLDYGQLTTGQPYMVLEWLEGRTLRAEIDQRGPLAPSDALAILEELGGALEAAHALGVIHRDIKADNVMAMPQGEWFTIKLLDFGIAKLTLPELRADMSTTIGVVGTPMTMAPEQILGEAVDPRTDVYGLGLLLYQLVTGRLPFSGRTPLELEELHLHAPPPLASTVAPVPESFDAVVARCLEKRIDARYPSVQAFLEDLRASVANRSGVLGTVPWAFGVHVEARIDPALEDPDDEVLDDVDQVLRLAREGLEEANLGAALETGNAVLFAATLPAAIRARTERRAELIDAVLELARGIDARPGRSRHVEVAFTLHAALSTAQAADPSRISGDLLRLSEWTDVHPGEGVIATAAAVEGLDGVQAGAPLADRPDRRRLAT
ncbi:MAG TPA: serine/threonine-protein kinase [Kofleriaceae bacterium]